MEHLKGINEWFDFRSKKTKNADEIIDSIINGIEIEKPQIESKTKKRGSTCYKFNLDNLIEYEDQNGHSIVVNCGEDYFMSPGGGYTKSASDVIVGGEKLEHYSKKKFKELVRKLYTTIDSKDTERKDSKFSRLDVYKKGNEISKIDITNSDSGLSRSK